MTKERNKTAWLGDLGPWQSQIVTIYRGACFKIDALKKVDSWDDTEGVHKTFYYMTTL